MTIILICIMLVLFVVNRYSSLLPPLLCDIADVAEDAVMVSLASLECSAEDDRGVFAVTS